jgi:hypothetical protein
MLTILSREYQQIAVIPIALKNGIMHNKFIENAKELLWLKKKRLK